MTTFFWLAVSYAQIVLHRLIVSRFVSDRLAGFVDLVSAANLSMLLLDEPYHGYYIHGQTVHEHADTSMEEMREQLLKEQLGLVKPRGLSDEKDTFEVFVSRDFRARYDDTFTTRLAFDLRHRAERKRGMTLYCIRSPSRPQLLMLLPFSQSRVVLVRARLLGPT